MINVIRYNYFYILKELLLFILCLVGISNGFAQSYCSSSASAPWQQWVERVQLNTMDNESSKCDGPCGYSDFTNLSTDLENGSTYTITIEGLILLRRILASDFGCLLAVIEA